MLPAALLALLAGFAGQLNWRHAVVLLIEGGVLLFAWQEISAGESAAMEKIEPEFGRNGRNPEQFEAQCCALHFAGGDRGDCRRCRGAIHRPGFLRRFRT